jgi:hypothetical protein
MGPRTLSLNEIRSSELIGNFRDEKIHLALAFGAKGSPRLKREAFTGARVEGQLFMAVKEFVNDAGQNKIVPGDRKIHISRLYKWYGADFRLDFASPGFDDRYSETEKAVLAFLAHYLNDQEQIDYLAGGGYKISYLPFDWRLNDWAGQHAAQ